MIGMRFLAALAAVVSVTFASALSAAEDEWHLTLLKRQEPGTPLYACHESCGTGITASRGASPCTDNAFLSDYQECLECAGPSNFNIWRYYGATLTTAGAKCGLSTTPISGSPVSVTTSSAAPTTSTTSTSASVSASVESTPAVSNYTAASTGSATTTAGNSTSTRVPISEGASAHGKMAGAFAIVAGAVFAAASL